jgi:hypothetical protein
VRHIFFLGGKNIADFKGATIPSLEQPGFCGKCTGTSPESYRRKTVLQTVENRLTSAPVCTNFGVLKPTYEFNGSKYDRDRPFFHYTT